MSGGETRRRRLGGVPVGYRDRVDLSARNVTLVRAASHRSVSFASAGVPATKNPSLTGTGCNPRYHPACPASRPNRSITRSRRAPDRPTRQTLQPVGSGATFGCENPPAHTISGSLGVPGRPTPPRQRLCVVRIVPGHRDWRDEPSAQRAQRNRNNASRLPQEYLAPSYFDRVGDIPSLNMIRLGRCGSWASREPLSAGRSSRWRRCLGRRAREPRA